MIRSDLVKELMEHFPLLSHKDANLAVKIVLDTISTALVEGRRVEIRGFGSFQLRHHIAYVGHDPRDGEPILIPERYVPYFRPGKILRCAAAQNIDSNHSH